MMTADQTESRERQRTMLKSAMGPRIAAALGVSAADLVKLPGQADLPVAALLARDSVEAPARPQAEAAPQITPGLVAVRVTEGVGDYRAGDELWCTSLPPGRFGEALNRDVLVPRPAGRFIFARLIGRDGMLLHLLPLGPGSRQQVVSDPPWIGLPVRLIRGL